MEKLVHLHAQGKDAISALLTGITDSGKTVGLLLVNPDSSRLAGDLSFTYCGLVNAYLVEVILARTQIKGDVEHNPQWYFFLGSSAENYPYWLGVITKHSQGFAKESDLPVIAAQYRSWWERNKHRSLDQLRSAWARGDRPLTGTEFRWQ